MKSFYYNTCNKYNTVDTGFKAHGLIAKSARKYVLKS